MDWTPGSRDIYASTHATHVDSLNPSMTSCDAYAHEREAQAKGAHYGVIKPRSVWQQVNIDHGALEVQVRERARAR
eukprot:3197568-Amphidinium_carterae.2